MDAKSSGFIRSRRYDAPLVWLSANDHRFPFEVGIEQFLDGDKKCIHVDMENDRVHCFENDPRGCELRIVDCRLNGLRIEDRRSRSANTRGYPLFSILNTSLTHR